MAADFKTYVFLLLFFKRIANSLLAKQQTLFTIRKCVRMIHGLGDLTMAFRRSQNVSRALRLQRFLCLFWLLLFVAYTAE